MAPLTALVSATLLALSSVVVAQDRSGFIDAAAAPADLCPRFQTTCVSVCQVAAAKSLVKARCVPASTKGHLSTPTSGPNLVGIVADCGVGAELRCLCGKKNRTKQAYKLAQRRPVVSCLHSVKSSMLTRTLRAAGSDGLDHHQDRPRPADHHPRRRRYDGHGRRHLDDHFDERVDDFDYHHHSHFHDFLGDDSRVNNLHPSVLCALLPSSSILTLLCPLATGLPTLRRRSEIALEPRAAAPTSYPAYRIALKSGTTSANAQKWASSYTASCSAVSQSPSATMEARRLIDRRPSQACGEAGAPSVNYAKSAGALVYEAACVCGNGSIKSKPAFSKNAAANKRVGAKIVKLVTVGGTKPTPIPGPTVRRTLSVSFLLRLMSRDVGRQGHDHCQSRPGRIGTSFRSTSLACAMPDPLVRLLRRPSPSLRAIPFVASPLLARLR